MRQLTELYLHVPQAELGHAPAGGWGAVAVSKDAEPSSLLCKELFSSRFLFAADAARVDGSQMLGNLADNVGGHADSLPVNTPPDVPSILRRRGLAPMHASRRPPPPYAQRHWILKPTALAGR